MAEAVLAGLVRAGHPLTQLIVSEVIPARRDYLASTYNVQVTEDNSVAAAKADLIVLAVKPNHVPQVLRGVCSVIKQRQSTLLSVAAGVRVPDMCKWLGQCDGYMPHVVRCMPNTPALVACGAAGVYAGEQVTTESRELVETVLRAVSNVVCWVEREDLLDAVTAVSGSGPAYFFLLMECMSDAGVAAGLPRDIADQLTIQTCFGAAKMSQNGVDSFANLRQKVTSPNGTTYAALMHMEANNVAGSLRDAVVKAAERSKELGDELSRDNAH